MLFSVLSYQNDWTEDYSEKYADDSEFQDYSRQLVSPSSLMDVPEVPAHHPSSRKFGSTINDQTTTTSQDEKKVGDHYPPKIISTQDAGHPNISLVSAIEIFATTPTNMESNF